MKVCYIIYLIYYRMDGMILLRYRTDCTDRYNQYLKFL